MHAPQSILNLFLRTLAWLPLAFLLWIIAAPVLHFPIAVATQALSWFGIPQWLLDVEQGAHTFNFITTLKPASTDGTFDPNARVTTEVNALLYTFGLPLFAALTLAAAQPRWGRTLWCGYLILLPFQLLAVYATGLKQLAFNMGPIVAQQMEFGTLQRTLTAYAYQFSTLIMPPVTALVVWFFLHRQFVESFVRGDLAAPTSSVGAVLNGDSDAARTNAVTNVTRPLP
jgi:hypothetical protein